MGRALLAGAARRLGLRARLVLLLLLVALPAFALAREAAAAGLSTTLLLTGVLGLALVALAAEYLILAPMRILAQAADQLSHGDLQARTGLPRGADEFGVLAANLDSLAAAVESQVEARTEALRDSQAELDRTRAAAEQANRAKTEFLAAASHDLRQPLQAMSLYMHLLRGKLTTPEQQTLADLVSQSTLAACDLVDTLMGLSALETGRIKPNVQPVAIAGLLRRIAEEARGEAVAKGLALRVRAIDAVVHTDPVLLERMLRNLVKNAVRYTENGGILVAARRDGAGCRLEVRDTGPGIPEEQLEAIFQDFYQLPGARAKVQGGLGLGLSTVARMGRLLGHETGVRSRLGRGSMFYIRLPQVQARLAA